MSPARLLAVLLLCACQRNVGAVEVFVVKSPRVAEDPLDPYLVGSVHLRLEAPGEGVIERVFAYEPGGSGTVEDVPAADGWVLTVEGIEAFGGSVRSRGRSRPFSVGEGTTQIEVWVGRTAEFSFAADSLTSARAAHTATALDDGRLLFAGGAPRLDRAAGPVEPDGASRSAEIFDPGAGRAADAAAETCAQGETLCMGAARAFHGATLLGDGSVVLSGGADEAGALATSDVRDAATGRFVAGPTLGVARSQHVALALDAGVLVAGGRADDGTALRAAELLDGDRFVALPALARARRGAAGAALAGGALVTGGLDEEGLPAAGPADLFDAGQRIFLATPGDPGVPRAFHAAVALGDGRVLIVGGLGTPVGGVFAATPSIEVFDPGTGRFETIGSLGVARFGHTATRLPDGTVLVAGGFGGNQFGEPVAQVEIVDPSLAGPAVARAAYALGEPRAFHTATLADNGFVVVAGGVDRDGEALASVEVLVP